MNPFDLEMTEDGMKAALIEARGDLFIAAGLLRTTAIKLNRAIQVSTVLRATMEELGTLDATSPITEKQIDRAIAERLSVYKVAGLDALHDLATMPIDANSAQNQVKLAAAARLVGDAGGGHSSGELDQIFRELREAYQNEAPRLRVIRERTTIETVHERDVSDQSPADP